MKTRLRFYVALSILLLFFTPFSAAWAENPAGWDSLDLHGGQVYAIAIDPADPNTILAGTYYGDGLFKTTDGGNTWHSVEGFRNELVYSIVFSPQNPSTIWVATSYSIYKSTDRGQTWHSYDPALTLGQIRYYHTIAVDPHDDNTAYIGTSGPFGLNALGCVYKTSDGGETWKKTPLIADHDVWCLAIDPHNTRTIWAVTGPEWVRRGSIYRSQDGGASWSKIPTSLKRGWFYFVVIHPQDSNTVFVGGENGLYRSKDGGITWAQLEPKSWCRAFSFAPENPNTLFAAWYDLKRDESVLSKSIDGGETWVAHDIYPLEFLALCVQPGTNQILYGGDAGLGVFKSTDDGESWHALNKGIKANPVYDSTISSPGNLLVGSQGGVFLQNAAGGWEILVPFPSRAVAISPENETTIFAGFDWGFGKSIDGGENWSFGLIPSPEANRVSSLSIDHQNPETLYLGVFYSSGNKGEIYKSTDRGENINLIKRFSSPVNALEVDPNNPQIIYVGNGMFYGLDMPGGFHKSTDGGESWEEKGLTNSVVNTLAIDSNHPRTIYAGCGGTSGLFAGLFKTTNGGDTWEKKDYGIPDDAAIVDIGIDTTNSNFLYAATHRHGTFISHDAGDYWTLLGLSDYWIYDILNSGPSQSASRTRSVPKNELLSSSGLYVGSGSGMFEYSGSGTGVISGMLTDANTGSGITGGTLSTNTGGIALSLNGAYIMFTPAGLCTMRASMDGYRVISQSGLMVASGDDLTVDLALTPLSPPNFRSVRTNLTAPPAAGDTLKITFAPTTDADVYSRWYKRAGVGTSNQGEWQLLSDWSKDNHLLTWSPASDSRYLVMAHAAFSPNSTSFHQICLTVETLGAREKPIQITDMRTTMQEPHPAETPITFRTTAVGGSGQLYYKYFYRAGTDGWNALGGWNTKSIATLTPPSNGEYTIVVHVSDDPAATINSPAQAGMTCTIGD